MKQEQQKQSTVLQEGASQESIGMSLDLESAHVLMQMLSKNLYSDAIGSTVRECASNALDSHRRAGTTDPIIVSLKINEQNNYEFAVEDFGTGLDADDVENIISKYGKSTKRNSDTELGMMGLGFKSPLAYSSSFYFVCRKDGVERKYMMYEGEDVNTIDLLYETPTEEKNGVKVIVPVKYNDRHTFREKIRNQLAYFESVYFDVNVNQSIITNEFHIYRAEDFQVSEMNTDQTMHICLDNVYYPLDYGKIGINPIQLPLGLRFNLTDGLYPTPNREQLIYSTTAIKTIKAKIDKVAAFLVEKYNENVEDCKDVHEIFTYYASQDRFIKLANLRLNTTLISGYTTTKYKKPQYANYKLTDFALLYKNRDYIFYEYKNHMNYSRGQFRQVTSNWDATVNYAHAQNPKKIFVYDQPFVGNKKSYIKSLLPPNDYDAIKFIKKEKKISLRNKSKNHTHDNYMTLLHLNVYPKDTWRARIQEFQAIKKELTKDFRVVDDMDIPQAWLDARRKKRVTTSNGGTRRVKLQGEINARFADELQRYVHGKNSKLTPTIIKVENVSSAKTLHVYGKQKDEALIDKLYSASANQKIKFFVLSEREHRVAEGLEIHNLISIETFMEGKNKPFKRIVTGYLIHELMEKYNDTFNKRVLLTTISKSLHDELTTLAAYSKQHFNSHYADREIYTAMLEIANEHKLYDETIYTEYLKIKDLLDTFPFIETTLEVLPHASTNEGNQHYLDVLVDLFKYNRIRIDYTNYKLRLNEDESLGKPITEETIEALTQNT
jgi:hypothetical protein